MNKTNCSLVSLPQKLYHLGYCHGSLTNTVIPLKHLKAILLKPIIFIK